MLEEKDRLNDSLVMQKYIAGGYNLAALEASNAQLKETLMGILREEHLIQHEIYNEMNSRGWYQPKTANMSDLSQNINKWNQELQRVQNVAQRQPGTQLGSYQSTFPQYGFQAGNNMPPMGNVVQQQSMYRPPQNPMA
ncbi:MAG: Coat F domain protein [Pelotomaculum sp. PtaB.Bin104]|nr:MAG: Coat F domain protein [Pelotomaculum sp. PtaB.Bin104]